MSSRHWRKVPYWILLLGLALAVAWAYDGFSNLQNDAKEFPSLHQSLPHGSQVDETSENARNNWRISYDNHLGQFYSQIDEGLGLALAFLLTIPFYKLVSRAAKFSTLVRRIIGFTSGSVFVALMLFMSLSQTYFYTATLGASPWWADSLAIPFFELTLSAMILLPIITVWSALAVYFGNYAENLVKVSLSISKRIKGELASVLLTAPLFLIGALGLTSVFTAMAAMGTIASALFLRLHIMSKFSTQNQINDSK